MVIHKNLTYTFVVSLGNGPNVCSKYFKITFTRKGKYEPQVNHQKITEKNFIVMSSDIGSDVGGGWFELMWDGVGLFNSLLAFIGRS